VYMLPAFYRRAADSGVAFAAVHTRGQQRSFPRPTGSKAHLSVALAEAAIQSGFGAYSMTAHDLVTDLGRAYREGRLDRRMRVYLAPNVLIIDEMGYLLLDEMGATPFSDW
jgi:DNA replication protein DnaC